MIHRSEQQILIKIRTTKSLGNLRIFCPLLGTVHYWGLLLNKNGWEAGFCPLLGAFPLLGSALLGEYSVLMLRCSIREHTLLTRQSYMLWPEGLWRNRPQLNRSNIGPCSQAEVKSWRKTSRRMKTKTILKTTSTGRKAPTSPPPRKRRLTFTCTVMTTRADPGVCSQASWGFVAQTAARGR